FRGIAMVQRCERFLRAYRRAEVETLELVACIALQIANLCCGFDALGEHRHAELVPERDDRAADACGTRVGADVLDEAAVDLELVERKLAQIAQARIAGAEIVERELDAEFLQFAHRAD